MCVSSCSIGLSCECDGYVKMTIFRSQNKSINTSLSMNSRKNFEQQVPKTVLGLSGHLKIGQNKLSGEHCPSDVLETKVAELLAKWLSLFVAEVCNKKRQLLSNKK